MLLPAQCAVEIWKASGQRTKERLNGLCEHFATVYAMSAQIEEVKRDALKSVPAWMIEG